MPPAPGPPRAQGTALLSTKFVRGISAIDRLRTQGALKLLFARTGPGVQGIMINTAGGLTGGDSQSFGAEVGAGSHLTLTTQAAERAYRAASGTAQVRSDLRVGPGASLFWLPQEMILYDGSALERRLRIDLAADARLLLVEPVIFGRAAMGERLRGADFQDVIEVDRSGAPLVREATQLSGDIETHLARAAHGAGAMALIVYIAPDAEAHLAPLRALLPTTGGISLMAPDRLHLRLLAPDSFALRRVLLPILDRLSAHSLPASWRL